MKKLDVDKHGDTNQYLIEQPGELLDAIDLSKQRADLEEFGATEVLTEYTRLMSPIPTTYPYVVVIEAGDEITTLICTFVKPSAFTALPDDKEHLYEFSLRRSGLESPYKVRESKYQIPARDIFEAHLKLGQVHHRDEEYDLEVLSWLQVR